MKVFGTDYDGVIINIEPQKSKAFGTILQQHWGVNEKEAADFWIATGGLSRKYKFDYFYKNQYNKKLSNKDYQIIESEYSRLLKKDFYPYLQLLHGALDLLKFARSNFDYTFVSSGVPMEEIQYLVRTNCVAEYFDLVLGTNQQFVSKREHFEKIKSRWNPDLIIFIADSPEDMKIANEFKAKSLGVLTNHTKEELIDAGAMKVCNLSGVINTIKPLIENID